jgi:hypothetical protein
MEAEAKSVKSKFEASVRKNQKGTGKHWYRPAGYSGASGTLLNNTLPDMMEHDAYIFVHQGWLEVEPEVAWAMGGSISLIKFGFRLVLTGVCFRSCDYGGYIGALHYWCAVYGARGGENR